MMRKTGKISVIYRSLWLQWPFGMPALVMDGSSFFNPQANFKKLFS
jgi:hypothetical protein